MAEKFTYGNADKFLRVNDDDPELTPIKIYLPAPPDYKLIDGYGKKPEDQMWERPKIPPKLISIQRDGNTPRTLDQIWDVLESRAHEYKQEIEWIKRQWYFRLNGYWFFNNGIPTYITGVHLFYLTSYQLDEGYPEYRCRDRKDYIFQKFCEEDTWDFVDKDKDGNAIADENGYYKMYDTGARVCYGDVYPKYRREGATYKSQCGNYEYISRTKNAEAGIQSRDIPDAKEVFTKKLVMPWKTVPFWFKPLSNTGTDPQSKIVFDVAAKRGGETHSIIRAGLQSLCTFDTGLGYDSHKLKRLHNDEIGKDVNNDIIKRHNVVKQCLHLAAGKKIVGFMRGTSTSGEMEKGGGEQFQMLCSQSKYYQRNGNGQTTSGLYRHFISTTESDIFYDKYGNADREAAREFLLEKRKGFIIQGDTKSYEEEIRMNPITYSESFSSSSAGMGFNTIKIQDRMNDLRFKKPIKGNFIFPNPRDLTSRVEFRVNENGKFTVSMLLPDEMTNRKQTIQGTWCPFNPMFTSASDPFRMNETEGKRKSNGGGITFQNRDFNIDPESRNISEWETNKFVCTYDHRPPTTEEYSLDMLAMCIYYGSMINVETNCGTTITDFQKWNFRGYLLHIMENGVVRKTPGTHAGDKSQEKGMLLLANYIDLHCHRENHIELLGDLLSIPSIKKLTDYDLVATAGLCLYGVEYGYRRRLTSESGRSRYDISTAINCRRTA